jgi:hypothetical protein
VFNPEVDPEGGGAGRPRTSGLVDSDRVCPWCGEKQLKTHKKMPDPRGPGILAYLFFPVAALLWLTTPTYNVCPTCGFRWQRGVRIEPARRAGESQAPAPRAGMYAEQVPAAAVVRRRPRLQPDLAADGVAEVELRAPPGSCRICRQAAGRYDVRDVPPIPVPGCVCEGGCKCRVVPAEA